MLLHVSSPGEFRGSSCRSMRGLLCSWLIVTGVVSPSSPSARATETFVRGDVDQNGSMEISDAIGVFSFLFSGGRVPGCMDAVDSNDSGDVDISDGIFILNYLFSGGPAPPDPYPRLGVDPTADLLDCGVPTPCETIVNSIGMRLVRIESGQFVMGSPDEEPGRFFNEGPPHRVTISRAFYLGVTEVTQGQYETVMGVNPSRFMGGSYGVDPDRPVEQVTWFDADEFCRKISELEGKTYRLPTEAEWEYSCRAGTETRYSFGEALSCDEMCVPCDLADPHLWYCGNNLPEGTKKVGTRNPNPWCLHDMHGGVREWCRDWYERYSAGDVTDPQGAVLAEEKILRGGYWGIGLRYCRSAQRGDLGPEHAFDYLGFRVLLEIAP
jgi:formylglycine-generating enzyme required for sulfatase activity